MLGLVMGGLDAAREAAFAEISGGGDRVQLSHTGAVG
jgi:hypothetical protein